MPEPGVGGSVAAVEAAVVIPVKAFADARRGRTLPAHPVPPPPALVSWFAKKFDTPDDYIEMWEEDFGYEDRKTIYRNLAEHYLYCRLIEDEAE